MSWEESQRKEQIFRKAKTNREVILKTVEDEDGNITLSFSLKNSDVLTEIFLTVAEWKSILAFLNKTSELILGSLSEKQATPVAEPIAKPLAEPFAEPIAEAVEEPIVEPFIKIIPETISEVPAPAAVTDGVKLTIAKAEPVADEAFEVLAAELEKVPRVAEPDIPVVPSEEVITEIKPVIEEPIEEEQVPEENLESIGTELSEKEILEEARLALTKTETTSEGTEDEEVTDSTIEPVLSAPAIPKVPEPSQGELESLLTPIQQPKITLMNEPETEEVPLKPSPMESEPSEEEVPPSLPEPPQIAAEELLDESIAQQTSIEDAERIISMERVDTYSGDNEKETKIIAAMEEVAALMPPGPAKKFVEEMMLKRAVQTGNESPRLPQKQ